MDNKEDILKYKIEQLEGKVQNIEKEMENVKSDLEACKTTNKLIEKDIDFIKQENMKQSKILEVLSENSLSKRDWTIILFIMTTVIGGIIGLIFKLIK